MCGFADSPQLWGLLDAAVLTLSSTTHVSPLQSHKKTDMGNNLNKECCGDVISTAGLPTDSCSRISTTGQPIIACSQSLAELDISGPASIHPQTSASVGFDS